MTTGAEGLTWRKSTRCDSGSCVEVAVDGDHVLIRNSTDPAGARLIVTRAQWAEFLDWLRTDGLD
jgi:hypothetical protein